MKTFLISLYRSIFAQPRLFRTNTHLLKLHVRTLGILNSETEEATGEPWFINTISKLNPKIIVDVGANDHAYGEETFTRSIIFAFEPHPTSFKRLEKNAQKNVIPVEAAVGEKNGKTILWDFSDSAPRKSEQPTSQLATLHPNIITDLYKQPQKNYSVRLETLDNYFKNKEIKSIDLLKIDAEGNELAVLKGAKRLLSKDTIKIIQFEFNETHAYSHVLMKDFYDILPNFTFYRLLPSGLAPLGAYRPLTHEIFGFQNIVAIHPKSKFNQLVSS